MKTMSRSTNAERAGRSLGRTWRGFIRQEGRVIRWLASKGVPAGVASLLFWIVKLVIFGAAVRGILARVVVPVCDRGSVGRA
jgi:hypothetical protein